MGVEEGCPPSEVEGALSTAQNRGPCLTADLQGVVARGPRAQDMVTHVYAVRGMT